SVPLESTCDFTQCALYRTPPNTVPKIFATKLVPSSSPLPRDKIDVCKISGIMPYLAGTKNALWVPIKNTIEIINIALITASTCDEAAPPPLQCGNSSANSATLMIPTSINFQNTTMFRLLYLSARTPASGEKRKNGVIKQAVTIET